MEVGQNGLIGAAASLTAGKVEQENATILLLYLVEQIVQEMIMENLLEHAMVALVVQV